MEEIIEIADDGSGDTYIDKKGRKVANHAFIERARLRIDGRKWHISRISPRKYGEGFLDMSEPEKPLRRVEISFFSGTPYSLTRP